MRDLIDREQALKVVSWDSEAYYAINNVPSAEKTGEWIKEPNCMFRCSVCGEHYPSITGYMRYRFCPNCGAKMEG